MSLSARRLRADTAIGRFHWQGHLRRAADSDPSEQATPEGGVTAALRDLPSPMSERLAAVDRDAFARGFAEGERAGERAASAKLEQMLQRLAATIEEIGALRHDMMHRAERELVRLAVAMAERIVRRQVDLDRELLIVMARVAIDRLGDSTVATVHLNPIDFEAATRGRDLSSASVQIVGDPAVPRGGCLVKSSFGTIDASIESQVRELSRALLGEDGSGETRTDDDTRDS
jgi:flagellar assembly protein FliH